MPSFHTLTGITAPTADSTKENTAPSTVVDSTVSSAGIEPAPAEEDPALIETEEEKALPTEQRVELKRIKVQAAEAQKVDQVAIRIRYIIRTLDDS